MGKQDGNGVRTAADLERKYNFAGMKKAVQLHEEGINKIDSTLETFVRSTLKSDANIQAQSDGEITTWFGNGEPTLDNEPSAYWVTDEQKEAHAGDLYYDRETGNAYEFVLEDDLYKWGIVADDATIESLALANGEYDTKDNMRRLFTAQPYPPYENGDLWFDGTDIFICQISKGAVNTESGEAEMYAEGDFIIATKYTDNTVANQVGDEVRVLEGQVLTVIENEQQFRAEVYDKDEKTAAAIDLINESLSTLIKGHDGESVMTQTENGWEFNISDLLTTIEQAASDIESLEGVSEQTVSDLNDVKTVLETVQKVTAYMTFRQDKNGDPVLELGTTDNGFKSVHTNTGIEFMQDDIVLAYINNEALNIERAVIHEELKIGGFLLKERANGNVGFVWRGDD